MGGFFITGLVLEHRRDCRQRPSRTPFSLLCEDGPDDDDSDAQELRLGRRAGPTGRRAERPLALNLNRVPE